MNKKKKEEKRGRPKKLFVSYLEASNWAKENKINSTLWRKLAEEKKLPEGFPVSPERSYKEFTNWAEFLGRSFRNKTLPDFVIGDKFFEVKSKRDFVKNYIYDFEEPSEEYQFYLDKLEKYSSDYGELYKDNNTINLFNSIIVNEGRDFKRKFGEKLYWFFYIIYSDLISSTEIKISQNGKRIEHIKSHPSLGFLKNITELLIINEGDIKNFISLEDLRDGRFSYQKEKDRINFISDKDIHLENDILFLSNLYFILTNNQKRISQLIMHSYTLKQMAIDSKEAFDRIKSENEKQNSINKDKTFTYKKIVDDLYFITLDEKGFKTLTNQVLNLIKKFSADFSKRIVKINAKNQTAWINPEARALSHFRQIFKISRHEFNSYVGDNRESTTKIIKFEQNTSKCLFEADPFDLSEEWNHSFKPKYTKGETLDGHFLAAGGLQHELLKAMFDIVKKIAGRRLGRMAREKQNLINFRNFLGHNHLFIPILKATRTHMDANFKVTIDTESYVTYFNNFEKKIYPIAEQNGIEKLPIFVELIYYLMNTNYFRDIEQGYIENTIGNLEFRYQDEDLVVDYRNKEDESRIDQYILEKPYEFYRRDERSQTIKIQPKSRTLDDHPYVLGTISINLLPSKLSFKGKPYSATMIDDSMEPEINKFDKVLYIEQTDKAIEYGSLYLFKGGDVRRLVKPGSLEDGRVLIQAVNESKWPSNEVNIDDLNIIGKIIAVIKAY